MKPKILTSIITAACLTFTGCGFGMSVDSLLSAPMLSQEQEQIYTALQNAAGNDISLVYPRNGEHRSAFLFYDLDGDGSDEAAVFYDSHSDTESSVRVNILDCENGKWRSVYDHAGAGTSVEQVFFTDLGGSGNIRMAIGYGYITPTEKTLKIYSFSDGRLNTEYTESYYKMLSLDLDKDSGMDIAVINCNNENHGAYVSLVTDKGNGTECTSTVELNENTADLPSVMGGYIGNNTPALFIDGLLGSGSLSTEIVYCVNGQLRNPANLSGSSISQRTTRSQGLFCRDIDGDGIVEIPEREAFPGYRENAVMQYITNWNVFENYSIQKKYSSLTEPEKGYAFMLPVRWEGLVTVKTDSVTGEKVFYKFNSSLDESRLELMRILVCSHAEAAEKSLEGYVAAAKNDSAVYMVKFGDTEDNLLLTVAEVSNNFYLY
ncbi:MAG: hypothetical protein IJ368_07815 [Oscillospiraceae bacterium]|nr:hypothetical protein [Oscillospiraceae bacterium]